MEIASFGGQGVEVETSFQIVQSTHYIADNDLAFLIILLQLPRYWD